MEYLIIIVLLAVVIFFFLLKGKSADSEDTGKVEATYVCDECGEDECICHKEDEK